MNRSSFESLLKSIQMETHILDYKFLDCPASVTMYFTTVSPAQTCASRLRAVAGFLSDELSIEVSTPTPPLPFGQAASSSGYNDRDLLLDTSSPAYIGVNGCLPGSSIAGKPAKNAFSYKDVQWQMLEVGDRVSSLPGRVYH
jgi:hypothetical protein